jgi:hypothetical protein
VTPSPGLTKASLKEKRITPAPEPIGATATAAILIEKAD